MTAIPYDDIDPEIRKLCRAINALPGIQTTGSCQGWINMHRPTEWWVMVEPEKAGYITRAAWKSIFLLAWITNAKGAVTGCPGVSMTIGSADPWLNGTGRGHFWIEGGIPGVHPDTLAELISEHATDLSIVRPAA